MNLSNFTIYMKPKQEQCLFLGKESQASCFNVFIILRNLFFSVVNGKKKTVEVNLEIFYASRNPFTLIFARQGTLAYCQAKTILYYVPFFLIRFSITIKYFLSDVCL